MFGLLAAVLVVVADQLSKAVVFGYLSQTQPVIAVTSFFNLVTAWNTGVSFSMLDNLGKYSVHILSGFSILVVIFLCYLLYREKNRVMQMAIGFVIGGAIGNVIDRIRIGAVFDFLDVHIAEHHWPAFNVADSFICIGALLIIFGGTVISCRQASSKRKKREGK